MLSQYRKEVDAIILADVQGLHMMSQYYITLIKGRNLDLVRRILFCKHTNDVQKQYKHRYSKLSYNQISYL